jgi:hypothetical protein
MFFWQKAIIWTAVIASFATVCSCAEASLLLEPVVAFGEPTMDTGEKRGDDQQLADRESGESLHVNETYDHPPPQTLYVALLNLIEEVAELRLEIQSYDRVQGETEELLKPPQKSGGPDFKGVCS